MLLEQLGEQEYKDGRAFKRLMENEEAWPALMRLIQRLDDDLIRSWTADDTGQRSKKWLRGARESLGAVLPAITQMSQDADAVVTEKQELETGTRSRAEDGVGSGDLSIS